MKIFNKDLFLKLVVILSIFFSLCFLVPNVSNASLEATLINPVVALFVKLGDGLMTLIQRHIFGVDYDAVLIVDLNQGLLEGVLAVVAGVLCAVAVATLVCLVSAAAVAVFALGGISLASVSVGTVLVVSLGAGLFAGVTVYNNLEDEVALPTFSVSPEEIFRGEIPLLNGNFFADNSKKLDEIKVKLENGNFEYSLLLLEAGIDWTASDSEEQRGIEYIYENEEANTADKLKGTVSKWYMNFRNISIILMMSVLVYVGIKIILSSTGKEKAKYKNMLIDWLVGLCMLFLMHYGMSFLSMAIEKMTNLINMKDRAMYVGYYPYNDKMVDALNDAGYKVEKLNEENYENDKRSSGKYVEIDSQKYILWESNLMGALRQGVELTKDTDVYIGYALMYAILIILTVYFIWVYLKRMLYLAFFTLIAPLVAFTYPLDKLKDGQAQAFDFWLKEYLYNLLLQPFHLLLYKILVLSAMELAVKNVIYGIVALGFMVPAEKLLKQMFGFKGNTPGSVPGVAGGVLMMEGLKKLTGWGPGPRGKRPKSDESAQKEDSNNNSIKTKSVDAYGIMGAGADGDNNSVNDNENNGVLGNNDENPQLDFASLRNRASNARNLNGQQSELDNAYSAGFPDSYDSMDWGNYLSRDNSSANGSNGVATNSNIPNNGLANNNNVPANGNNRLAANNNVTNNRNEKASSKKGKGIGKALLAGGGAYLRGMTRKISKVRPLEKGMRFTGKAIGGALLGGAGLAIGIATGDPQNAYKYAAIGAKGGANLTDAITDKAANALRVEGSLDAAKRAYYGDEYKEKLQEEQYKKWIENHSEELIRSFGGLKNFNKMKKDGTLKDYYSSGINDVSDIYSAEKFKEDHPEFNTDGAIGAIKIAKQIGDYKNMSAKDQGEADKTLRKNFKESNSNLTDEQLDKLVERQKIYIKEIHSNKDKFI